jgi:hypothetical protein
VETGRYRLTIGAVRSTEALVAAGDYAYAHSCVTSENFPARPHGAEEARELVLLAFDRPVTSAEAIGQAAARGLRPPTYEDALHFGAQYPDVQRLHPVVFLHDPWLGFFGRRDVLCLWTNAGRRELGLEGFDDVWSPDHRLAFAGPGVHSAHTSDGGPAPWP